MLAMVLLSVSLMVKPTHAINECYRTYDEVIAVSNAYKKACEEAEGGGATYYSSITSVDSCYQHGSEGAEIGFANGYNLFYGCNLCTSKEAVIEVEDFKNECAEQCRLTDYSCSPVLGSWSSPVFSNKVCSKIDSTATGAKKK